MTADDNNNDVHPYRIYGKEYKVPESKMGKATMKGYPVLTSSGEGSKVTSGGATLHLQRPKGSKEEKKDPALWLGGAPKSKDVGKATVPPETPGIMWAMPMRKPLKIIGKYCFMEIILLSIQPHPANMPKGYCYVQ